jgi:hypothetical protein
MDSSIKNKAGHRGKQENSPDLENEIRDLKDDVANLTSVISNLKKQMNYLENLVTNELVKLIDEQIENKNLNNNDVELDSSKGDEDSLTPSHLFTLSTPLRETAIELLKLRITTAEEISKYTKKQRAVESSYLNQLVKKKLCRKIRIGRKIFFYIGSLEDLKPFQSLSSEFRSLMLTILRVTPSNKKELTISLQQLSEEYLQLYDDEDESNEDLNKLTDLANLKLDFISKDTNSALKSPNITFDKNLWREL